MKPEFSDILPRLYKYCAYQDRCRSEILKKLWEWEVQETLFEAILVYLQAEKFWDEKRFARSFVRGKFYHKKWGRIKIRNELRKKSVPSSLIETALRDEISMEDYQTVLAKLTEKKLQEWNHLPVQKQKEKLYRFLTQKGFEWENVREFTNFDQ